MKKIILLIFFLGLIILPGTAKAAEPSVLMREYLFPIQYSGDVAKNDVIGLRIYSNPDNKEPLTWYLSNVTNPKANLPKITADGYQAVRDDRTVYIQASNLVDVDTITPTFYTNIYVLAYNQNATADTLNIYNQMLSNIKFNKNIMDLYCLPAQYEAVKDRLRRDTLRKADLYKMKVILSGAPNINLQAGTYVPGITLSTWPSWQATLAQQLGTALPVDPLNIMADHLIGCTTDAECETRQCSGGYCSACLPGWDPRTCWNERDLDYQAVDGFVYKYQTAGGVLTIRYEWPQIVFPETAGGECFLGCLYENAYYLQGSCLPDNRYCNAGTWTDNVCGDGTVRCGEVCDCANMAASDCYCATGCLTCKDHYHAVGSICEEDRMTVTPLTQHLSTAEEIRWTGSGWSNPYATACKANAILSGSGVCNCKTNYHEEWAETEYVCIVDARWFGCYPKPLIGAVWNSVSGYSQTYDGEKWIPADTDTAYNEDSSSNTCRFKCDQYYVYNSDDNTCDGQIQTADCDSKPANTVWNNDSGDDTFTKVWNGAVFSPETVATVYDDGIPVNGCNYKCDTNYTWDGDSCEPDTNEFYCSGNPPNSDWFYLNGYEQTWDGSSWIPPDDTTPIYDETIASGSATGIYDCRYHCKFNYTWDGSNRCTADTRSTICVGKPLNTEWTGTSSYSQTWDGSDWQPQIGPVYNDTDTTACHFKCTIDFVWDGSACVKSCLGFEIANADKCSTQGDTDDELGITVDTYWSATDSCTATKCQNLCRSGYTLVGNACLPQCTGTDPANSTLCSSDNAGLTVNTPKTVVGACSSPAGSNPKCEYACNQYYHFDGTSCMLNQCGGSIPANASLCPGQGTNLSVDGIPRTSVNFCTSGNKCEYYCTQHNVLRGGSCQPGNLVFITSDTYNGNLGGISGADAKCSTEANARGYNGFTFMAWISTSSSTDPESRFIRPTTFGYYLNNGTKIADNWSDLVDGSLANTLSLDLYDVNHITPHVYTGTNFNGTAFGGTCDGFTRDSGWPSGLNGISNYLNSMWSRSYDTFMCSTSMRLYCFAQ